MKDNEVVGHWNKSCASKQRIDNKTVLVTGANTGIGFHIAAELARRGATVIMACRNLTKAEDAKKRILDLYGSRNPDCSKINVACAHMEEILTPVEENQLIIKQVDISSLDSIRNFADDINANISKLDILINNAGLYNTNYDQTPDGFEWTVGVNYLGPFLLTHLLIAKLEKPNCSDVEQQSRIINVSSKVHIWSRANLEKLFLSSKNFKPFKAYSDSKLYNTMHAAELSRRLQSKGIITASLHPGVVRSDIFRNLGSANRAFWNFFLPITSVTSWQGAQTALYTVLSKNIISGSYYSNCGLKKAHEFVENKDKCLQLWNKSMELSGLK